MASSKVSSLRVRISSVGRPKVKGSRWKAKMIFEPRLLITWLTLSFRPRTIDEIPMTTATPITMPSTVSDERSLLLRIVSTAMFRPSPSSPFASIASQPFHRRDAEGTEKPVLALWLLPVNLRVPCGSRFSCPNPQPRDWVQQTPPFCGIPAEKNPNARRHEYSRQYCPEFDLRGHA